MVVEKNEYAYTETNCFRQNWDSFTFTVGLYRDYCFFMIGDGLEQGWLSPYLVEQGLTMKQSGLLFTVYGITVSVSAWFSGVFVQMWGPRRAMTFGLAAFIIGSIGFIGFWDF
ncbi:hypothetical protein GCM10020331_088220 [Ectobacillus funiculus]